MEPARIIRKILIHVGRPDTSLPHKDMSLIQSFVKANPDCGLVILVDTEKDHQEIGEKVAKELVFPLGHPGGFIIEWKDDSGLMDLLCGKMTGAVTWKVVGGGWYKCENGHILGQTHELPREKCDICSGKLEHVKENEARVNQFGVLLRKAVSLMGFDTRSGVMLNIAVNPDANAMRNVPEILGCEHKPAMRLKDLVGLGKGKPCLAISAGPSVDDEIGNILRLQKTHLILCVGRLYKRLRDAGIRVDYTFSCEMFDWDAAIFDDLGPTGNTVLCYPSVCAPATVKRWPGKKVCMMDPSMAILLDQPIAMSGGNSVSHHLLNFAAEILDCEPIILVGQDLSYTKPGMTHATGSAANGWPIEVRAQDAACHAEIEWAECNGKGGRFHPECHRQAVAVAGGVVPVGGIQVMTSKPYMNFATLFEILISRHKKKVFNACGEGLKIAGAPYINLSEVK